MDEFEKLVPEGYREVLVDWAEYEPLIDTVRIFGSVIKGSPCPNDLDIAVTLVDTVEEIDNVWIDNNRRWAEELGLKIGCKIDLQLDHNAPTVRAGVEEASVLIYERNTAQTGRGKAMSPESNSELRCHLKKITSQSPDNWERLISELTSTHPHSIRCLPHEHREPYTCFESAFELADSHAYRKIAESFADWGGSDADNAPSIFFVNFRFVDFLIGCGVLVEINKGELTVSDVVVYLDDEDTPQHAGKIAPQEGLIKSKWGGGLFLEHGLWEVPESYGNTARFFRSIPAVKAERAFQKFVESQNDFKEFIKSCELEDSLRELGDDVS